jgi:ABC-type sulfate transport system substrate-binding protein
VIDGLPADMVALALPLDIDKIVDAGLIRPSWTKAYPNNSVGACAPRRLEGGGGGHWQR